MKSIVLLAISLFSLVAFADVVDLGGSTKAMVSVDSPYTPTPAEEHNYRYRAVFSQDIHNEIPGTLKIEKVQLPDSEGSSHKMVWTHTVDPSKIKNVAPQFKALPFESALGCCMYSDLQWVGYKLKFSVTVADKKFNCTTSDASAGSPSVDCK